MNLAEINQKIVFLDEKIRPIKLQRDNLIKERDEYIRKQLERYNFFKQTWVLYSFGRDSNDWCLASYDKEFLEFLSRNKEVYNQYYRLYDDVDIDLRSNVCYLYAITTNIFDVINKYEINTSFENIDNKIAELQKLKSLIRY